MWDFDQGPTFTIYSSCYGWSVWKKSWLYFLSVRHISILWNHQFLSKCHDQNNSINTNTFFLEVWIRLVLLKYFVAWRFFDNNEESSCFMGNTDSCLNSPAFRDNKLCKLSQCWQFRVRGRHWKSILSPSVCVFVSLLNLSRLYGFGWVERSCG